MIYPSKPVEMFTLPAGQCGFSDNRGKMPWHHFISGQPVQGGYRMTSEGHDFLANTRDEALRKKTNEAAKRAAVDALPALHEIALKPALGKLKGMV